MAKTKNVEKLHALRRLCVVACRAIDQKLAGRMMNPEQARAWKAFSRAMRLLNALDHEAMNWER